MAAEEGDNFTGLVPGPADKSELDVSELDSELDSNPNIAITPFNISNAGPLKRRILM